MAKQPSGDLRIVLLDEQHDRGSFTCGVESLDRYLKTQAGQDVRRKANAVFVLSEVGEPARILGYYTLCAMAVSQGDVPEAARKHIPRYPLVSATLIGRLAVAKEHQGQRLGAVLLADALQRAFESASTVGSSMVVVDALDEPAAVSTRRMGSCAYPTRCGLCCRCASQAGGLNDEFRIRVAYRGSAGEAKWALASASGEARWRPSLAFAVWRHIPHCRLSRRRQTVALGCPPCRRQPVARRFSLSAASPLLPQLSRVGRGSKKRPRRTVLTTSFS